MQTAQRDYQDTYQALLSDPDTPTKIKELTPLEFQAVWQGMTPLQRFLLGARLWSEEVAS